MELRIILIMRVVSHWHRSPRKGLDAPPLQLFSQVGQGPEQPGLLEGVPAHGMGVGTG